MTLREQAPTSRAPARGRRATVSRSARSVYEMGVPDHNRVVSRTQSADASSPDGKAHSSRNKGRRWTKADLRELSERTGATWRPSSEALVVVAPKSRACEVKIKLADVSLVSLISASISPFTLILDLVPLAPAPEQQALPSISDLLDVLPRVSAHSMAESSRVGAFRDYTCKTLNSLVSSTLLPLNLPPANVPTVAAASPVLVPREADAANTLLHISAAPQAHVTATMPSTSTGEITRDNHISHMQHSYARYVEPLQPINAGDIPISPRTTIQLPSVNQLMHNALRGDATTDSYRSMPSSRWSTYSSPAHTSPIPHSTATSRLSPLDDVDSRNDSLLSIRAQSITSSAVHFGANANIACAPQTYHCVSASDGQDERMDMRNFCN
nr:hypothetical protein CFP56_03957 [Quercus suber]